MTSNQKQYINFSEKFDELASDIDDTCLVDSGGQVSTISLELAKKLGLEIFDEYGNIVSQRDALKEPKTTSTRHGVSCSAEKKSRYDAGTKVPFLRNKHRIKDSSKLLRLEIRFEILEDDLIELKRGIDDIKKTLSKPKSKTKHNTSSDSSESD
jgi:hypothetical protein